MASNHPQAPMVSTRLPGPRTGELLRRKSLSFTEISPGRVAPRRAFGPFVEDVDGNVFLDFSSDINAVGHGHPRVVEAIRGQLERFIGFSPVLSDPFIECAEALKAMLPGDLRRGKVGYATTGSEAIDLGSRLARAYTGRRLIISFHGVHFGEGTSDCSRLAGDRGPRYRGGLSPLVSETLFAPWPYCYRCPLGRSADGCGMDCLAYIETIFHSFSPEDVAAIIMEGLPANGGVLVPPEGYLQGLRALCGEHGIMLLVDEVFSGFGKTGRFLAVENWGVVPDIVCLGKAMGGGLPISAAAARAETIDRCDFLSLGTQGSFAGNAVSCAAAIATMRVIREEGLLDRAARLGVHAMRRLRELADGHEPAGDVRGMGLVLGLELVRDRRTKEPAAEEAEAVQRRALEGGLLISRVGRHRNVLRMTPPPIVTEEQLDDGIDILEKALKGIAPR